MSATAISLLSRRYTLVVAACGLPLFLLIGALGLFQFAGQRQAELESLAATVSESRLVIEAQAKTAADHLRQLKALAEDSLAGLLPPEGPGLAALLQPSFPPAPGAPADGLTLDAIADTPLQSRYGNLFLAAGRENLAAPGELEAALVLFGPTRLTHLVTPSLRWSYYFSASGAFITMFPSLSRRELVEGFGHASIGALIDDFLHYEVYLDLTPARNPTLAPQWSPPYLDAAGAGWMVSHAVPVTAEGRFVGVLGTDLLLSSLEATLQRLPLKAGQLWIVGAEGELLAGSSGARVSETGPRPLHSILPPALQGGEARHLTQPGRRDLAGHHLVAAPLAGTPWTLLFLVSDRDLAALVAGRVLPYGVILLGLLLTIFAAHFVLRSQFVRPAIQLAEHIQAGEAAAELPSVPRPWRPWVRRITSILAQNRETMARLAESELRYRSVVDAMPNLVIRFRPDGRLTFANEAYVRTTGRSREELLETHWNDFDLLPPEERERNQRHIATLTPERPIATIQLRSRRPDGSLGYEEWTDRGIFDAEGGLVEVQAVGRDITEEKRALAALAESEERYRTVVESQTEFVVRMTPEGRLTFVNDAYCRFYDLPREVLLGPDWCDLDVLPPAELARFREHLASLTPEQPVGSQELQNCWQGRTLWCAWIDRGIFDAEGRLIEIQSVGRDITDRVLAERARQETERLRQAVLEAALDGCVGIDEEGRIIEFNAAAEAIFGYGRSAVLGRSMAALLVPESLRTRHEAAFREQLATGRSRILGKRVEVPALRADGSLIPIELVIVRGSVAERPVFIAYLRDLGEQKRAAAALAESEAQFRAIAEGVPLSVVISAAGEPEVFFVNERARQTLGLEIGARGEGVTATWKWPEQRRELGERVAREGTVDAFETVLRRPDGSEMQALISARRIEQQGRAAVLAAITDITRQRAAEAELARQREALHQSEKLTALGSLLAGVAHELNNPLSVVVGYSSMLKEICGEPAVLERAERIHAAAERCSRIVRTFLAMARKRPPTRGPVDINAAVEDALELAAYGLRSGGVEVVRDLAEGLPPLWGDEDQLHQVFANLVVNAQQALLLVAPPRRLAVSSRLEGTSLEIVVADNGPGMPESVRTRIFEPFFTTKPSGVGTGVGLSVCRGVVEAHGGSITIESAPGAGARFTLRLPTGVPAGAAAEAAATAQEPADGGWSANVLVIDDEPDIAAMVAEILREEGHVVEIAQDARSALEIIARADIDLIVSDLRMPELDGPGLYRALQAARPELLGRLLFITGDTLAADIDGFLAESGAVVVDKPLDPVMFRRAVGGRLAAAETAGARPAAEEGEMA